jgi:caffeoyl-CoA O-methyltransferase
VADITEPTIERYAEEHSGVEPPHLAEVARETRATSSRSQMLVGRLEGRFLRMLVRLMRARRVLEIGTFTGYSALSMAEALPADGRIITCELDPEHAAIARRNIEQAGYGDRIEVREGRAVDTLATLEGPFDLIFIDADKPSYPDYYEAALRLLAPTGAIVIDNVLWSGEVTAPTSQNGKVLAALNDTVAADPRVDCVVLPIRDGMTLITLRRETTEG